MATNRWLSTAFTLVCLLAGTALGTTPANKCTAAKTKAAGAKVYAKARCYQEALATRAMVDPMCLAKAKAKFGSPGLS